MDTYKKVHDSGFFYLYHRKPLIIKLNRENGELDMSKIIFIEFQRKQLKKNPYCPKAIAQHRGGYFFQQSKQIEEDHLYRYLDIYVKI